MITGEDYWPDIKITYHGDSDSRLCYVAVEDEEVWHGIANKIEGEWFVTQPSLERDFLRCYSYREVQS
jgi:hypothetical protein